MEKVYYDSSFIVREGSAEDSSTSEDLVEFEGVISDSSLDSYSTRMGPTALRSYAKDANKGIMVLPEHNRRGQPIGRSISGKYNQKSKQVTSKFYIQKGLNLNESGYADTDSYIASMKAGTTRDLSIGAKVNKMQCDVCKEQMKPDKWFGWMFPRDKNGHYPGQKVKLEKSKKEITVTASINDAELVEFSIVPVGANKNSKIIQKAQQAAEEGLLTEEHLERLQSTFNINRSDLKLHQLQKGVPKMAREKENEKDLDNEEETSTENQPEDIELIDLRAENEKLKADLKEANELISEYEDTSSDRVDRINELKGKVKKLDRAQDEIDDLKEELEESNKTITKLQERVADNRQNEFYAEQYEELLEEARSDCLHAYCNAEGIKSTSDAAVRYAAKLEKSDNYNRIRNRTVKFVEDYHEDIDAVRERRARKRGRVPSFDASRYEIP